VVVVVVVVVVGGGGGGGPDGPGAERGAEEEIPGLVSELRRKRLRSSVRCISRCISRRIRHAQANERTRDTSSAFNRSSRLLQPALPTPPCPRFGGAPEIIHHRGHGSKLPGAFKSAVR
jgi:hypothetical protein